ncbi:uncharacterized protein PRCAT00005877001 [Priceomyces carsonii]|uniref:uncharacterized protein n=1 Tax=Priceomyces carsonii TaxID=28549 RepID=UPI002ED87F03|nr:unnamed protein product [Priceomyces carsonii]
MGVPFKILDWKAKVANKRESLKIPSQWRLDSRYLDLINESSTVSVTNVPRECGILTQKELEITEIKASCLLKLLISGKLSSYEVTLAFCKRAAIAHQLTNCLAEFFPEEGLQLAREIDEIFIRSGKPVGRLHGLPISFKEIFNISNHETTFAYVSYIGNIKNEDGLVVKCIKAAGGVPFCKTNISQGCLIVEGMNNVFGTCLNPNNLSLTAAGSSSGEGALVRMKGSPLGIGTDAGGSIRLPAHSNGVFGFMPSTNRITNSGIGDGAGPLTWVLSQIGPLTNDVKMIETWFKAMLDYKMEDYDSFCYKVPWCDVDLRNQRLVIGVIFQDNVVETTPAMLRCLQEVVLKMKRAGHLIIEIDVGELHRKITETVFQMYVSTGIPSYRNAIEASGEPCIARCCGSECKSAMSLQQVYSLDTQARKLCEEYLQNVFTKNNLHVLLTPSSPNPPAPHGKYSTNSLSAVYNCLGYPAGVVPTGFVIPEKDKPTEMYLSSGVHPDLDILELFPYDYYDKYVKEELYTDINKFKNAPLSIQIVGRKFTDEFVIKVMELIAELF